MVSLRDSDMLAFDRAHLWHPYTSMGNPLPVLPVEATAGVRLTLADGVELIDGMSSWWAAIHGYNHPVLNRAVTDQVQRMAHVMFGGLTHGPAVALGQRLVAMTPADLEHVFLCDSGSVAVEVAIKMAVQYQRATGHPQKHKLLSLRGGYHGDTMGCMSVCDPETGMHHLFAGMLPQQHFAPRPECPYGAPFDAASMAPLEEAFAAHGHELAALVLEPIVQGAGGMHFYHPAYLAAARALCDAHEVLLIADEIATGFGRSGTLFGCDHAGIAPDIMCLGKALTGGYLTLAAALCTGRVAAGISEGDGGGALMHGPTFMANPTACAVANASLQLLADEPWEPKVAAIGEQLAIELKPFGDLPGVRGVRTLGAIGVIEMTSPVDMTRVRERCLELGVWLRPFGKLIYTMPPYIMAPDDLSRVTHAMGELAKP